MRSADLTLASTTLAIHLLLKTRALSGPYVYMGWGYYGRYELPDIPGSIVKETARQAGTKKTNKQASRKTNRAYIELNVSGKHRGNGSHIRKSGTAIMSHHVMPSLFGRGEFSEDCGFRSAEMRSMWKRLLPWLLVAARPAALVFEDRTDVAAVKPVDFLVEPIIKEYIYIFAYRCICIPIYLDILTYICIYIYVYIYIYTFIYIFTYIYMYIHFLDRSLPYTCGCCPRSQELP